MKHLLLIFFIGLLLVSCNNQKTTSEVVETKDTICSYPPTFKVYLQPFNYYTKKEAEIVKQELNDHLQEIGFKSQMIEILPAKKLDNSFLNNYKTRYSAQKIVNSLNKRKKGEIYIGLLHEDISLPLRGRKDWGVRGLALLNGNAVVVSTFRIRNQKQDMWKTMLHEFTHTFASINHCTKDKNCLMRDANGKGWTTDQRSLCNACRNAILTALTTNNIEHSHN